MGIHFMSQRLSLLARSFVFVSLFLTGHALAAARLEPLTVAYSNFTGSYGPRWLAVEERGGATYGLALKPIYAGRVRRQELLASCDVPILVAAATGAITAH